MATIPGVLGMSIRFAYWGTTTVLLFWAAMIRTTREWGGALAQGRAFRILEGGSREYRGDLSRFESGTGRRVDYQRRTNPGSPIGDLFLHRGHVHRRAVVLGLRCPSQASPPASGPIHCGGCAKYWGNRSYG